MCVLDAMYDYAGETNELLVVGNKSTAGIFATYPSKHLTLLNGFSDQVSIDAVLFNHIMRCIFLFNEQECHIEQTINKQTL